MSESYTERVSVTWKWLAISLVTFLMMLCSVIGWFFANDRQWVGRVLERHDSAITELQRTQVTKDDLRRLEDKLDLALREKRP